MDPRDFLQTMENGLIGVIAKMDIDVGMIKAHADVKALQGHADVVTKLSDEELAVIALGGELSEMDHQLIEFHRGRTSSRILPKASTKASIVFSSSSTDIETRIGFWAWRRGTPMARRTLDAGSPWLEQAETEET